MGQMRHEEIDKIVRDVFAIVFQRNIEKNERVEREHEAYWDSLKHIELLFMLEERLGIQFSETQLAELDSLEIIVCTALELRNQEHSLPTV